MQHRGGVGYLTILFVHVHLYSSSGRPSANIVGTMPMLPSVIYDFSHAWMRLPKQPTERFW